MTDAPERIYLDGDVEVGDGMFPRCFENAKYASDPPVEYIRTDHVGALLKAEREKALREAMDMVSARIVQAASGGENLLSPNAIWTGIEALLGFNTSRLRTPQI